MKRALIVTAILVAVIIAVVALRSPNVQADTEMIVHRDSSCGCCGAYASYARSYYVVSDRIEQSMSRFKADAGVPAQMRSCHTTMIEGYFVEGHVPVEAIEKLLTDRPDIAGIAIPGMPSGSPGMPGTPGPMIVHAVMHDGSTEPFMEVR